MLTPKPSKRSLPSTISSEKSTIGRKIRDAELRKVPFILIVGENEASAKTVGVRRKGEGDLGAISVEEFVKLFQAGDSSKG